jgi:hypothetical protein
MSGCEKPASQSRPPVKRPALPGELNSTRHNSFSARRNSCGYYTDETSIGQRNIMTHLTGLSRHQTTLFPESLDHLITKII